MKIQVLVEGYDYVTNRADPDDDWDRDDTDFVVTNVRAVPLFGRYSFYDRTPDLPVTVGDKVYAVLVHYGTGDTFGRSAGRVSVSDIFTNRAEADALRVFLESFTTDEYTARKSKRVLPYSAEFNGVEYNIPWCGYFETFESCVVRELVVEDA